MPLPPLRSHAAAAPLRLLLRDPPRSRHHPIEISRRQRRSSPTSPRPRTAMGQGQPTLPQRGCRRHGLQHGEEEELCASAPILFLERLSPVSASVSSLGSGSYCCLVTSKSTPSSELHNPASGSRIPHRRQALPGIWIRKEVKAI
uniref:Uncharacterized protein n=1 Tax=Arundo donax TaxID=35708 RepID=A0A0A9FVQ6_ARUDO